MQKPDKMCTHYKVVLECTFVDEISLGISRLGLCIKTRVPLTSFKVN